MRIADKNALDLEQIDFNNLQTMERHFWQQSKIFELVSYIQFGSVNGEFVGLEVNDNKTVRYQVTEFSKSLNTYDIQEDGDRGKFLKSSPNYDPRNRPWYKIPRQADKAAWTNSGEHLLSLINDVLDMSKIEAGHITFHPHTFDLHRLLDTTVEMLEFKADAQNLQLLFERDPHWDWIFFSELSTTITN